MTKNRNFMSAQNKAKIEESPVSAQAHTSSGVARKIGGVSLGFRGLSIDFGQAFMHVYYFYNRNAFISGLGLNPKTP